MWFAVWLSMQDHLSSAAVLFLPSAGMVAATNTYCRRQSLHAGSAQAVETRATAATPIGQTQHIFMDCTAGYGWTGWGLGITRMGVRLLIDKAG